jgi:hypothetical protein
MIFALRAGLLSLCLVSLAGCGRDDHDHARSATSGHVHTAPHGGLLIEVGEHAYNLELLLDAPTGRLTAWVLDGHAENFIRIKAASLELIASVGAERRPLTLVALANSATGETVGDTSQFEVQTEWLKTAPRFEGVVPALEIRGANFNNLAFTFSRPAR